MPLFQSAQENKIIVDWNKGGYLEKKLYFGQKFFYLFSTLFWLFLILKISKNKLRNFYKKIYNVNV